MENNKNNNILPLVIIFLVILALIGGAYWFGKSSIMRGTAEEETMTDTREESEQKVAEKVEEDVSVQNDEENVVVDGEETGEPGEEVMEESDESVIETLKLLFAQKYERPVEDAKVTISEREGDYLVGGIKFEGDIAGGYVLAAKVNGAWKIIFDGNGNFTCDVVDVVDFPSTLAPECWDEATQTTVDRTAE